ncbi:MAG: hypothetical protein ACP5EQ_07485, partial [Candidatus Cloacimonadia bacterium]
MRIGTITRWCALRSILRIVIQEHSLVLDLGGYDGHICYKLKKVYPHRASSQKSIRGIEHLRRSRHKGWVLSWRRAYRVDGGERGLL